MTLLYTGFSFLPEAAGVGISYFPSQVFHVWMTFRELVSRDVKYKQLKTVNVFVEKESSIASSAISKNYYKFRPITFT